MGPFESSGSYNFSKVCRAKENRQERIYHPLEQYLCQPAVVEPVFKKAKREKQRRGDRDIPHMEGRGEREEGLEGLEELEPSGKGQ